MIKTMTTFEKCKFIRSSLLTKAAEVMNYNWSDSFSKSEIKDFPKKIIEKIDSVNISELSKSEMDDLGFGHWSEESEMRLIPLWLYPFLPPNLQAESICGTYTKVSEMSTDHRFGFLAYGIMPRNNN